MIKEIQKKTIRYSPATSLPEIKKSDNIDYQWGIGKKKLLCIDGERLNWHKFPTGQYGILNILKKYINSLDLAILSPEIYSKEIPG